MTTRFPFVLDERFLAGRAASRRAEFQRGEPFRHVVIDDFLPDAHAGFLEAKFPPPEHPVWLDWRTRSGSQYGKQGPGDSARFSQLDPAFLLALHEFNSWKFLVFLENVTGIQKLLPDPYFFGGGFHQILQGGILDIHTDFNEYGRLDLYRQLNVLLFLNRDWKPAYNGCLELWDGGAPHGRCVKSVAPIFNRLVVFHTTKQSFHGHPWEWAAPEPVTRKSLALYYYTARPLEGQRYDVRTDFQGVNFKDLPP